VPKPRFAIAFLANEATFKTAQSAFCNTARFETESTYQRAFNSTIASVASLQRSNADPPWTYRCQFSRPWQSNCALSSSRVSRMLRRRTGHIRSWSQMESPPDDQNFSSDYADKPASYQPPSASRPASAFDPAQVRCHVLPIHSGGARDPLTSRSQLPHPHPAHSPRPRLQPPILWPSDPAACASTMRMRTAAATRR
jgi:hypothetical protein